MTNADFFLEIAQQELDQLKRCAGPIVVGTDEYSEHFRHAVVSSVFSAFAVEYALTELIWVKCFFQTPEPHRPISLLRASKMHTIPGKLEFIQKTTAVQDILVGQMRKLFDYRNRIAHGHVKPFESKVLDFDAVESLVREGKGAELDRAMEASGEGNQNLLRALADEAGKESRTLHMNGIVTEDLDAAEENFLIATKAVKALRIEAGMVD